MFWLLGGTSFTKETKTSILYSSPSNNSNDAPIDKNVFIYFNSQIKSMKGIVIETSPVFEFKTSIENKTLKIEPINFLEENKNYKITLNTKNQKNPPLKGLPFVINFKTGKETEASLKQDSALMLKMENKIPFFSQYFDLTFLEDKNAFAIIINSKDCKQAKKRALNYLETNNVDIKSTKIIWYQGDKGNASCVPTK